MHPTLFQVPGWPPIHAYGTLILLGLWLTVPAIIWEARRRRLPGLLVFDLYLVLGLATIIGGRLGFVATSPATFVDAPWAIFAISDGGLVFYGATGGFVVGALYLARKYATSPSIVIDVVLTHGPLAQAIGRLGCLLAGCCYGAPTSAAVGVHMSPEAAGASDESLWHDGVMLGVHPAPAYEAAGMLALWALQLHARRACPDHGCVPWRLASRWAIAYGFVRFTVEMFRGDAVRGHVALIDWPAMAKLVGLPTNHPLLLSYSQLVSAGLIAVGLWGWSRTRTPRSNPDG